MPKPVTFIVLKDISEISEFNTVSTRGSIGASLINVTRRIKKEFEKTTSTWNHKPHFEPLKTSFAGLQEAKAGVQTTDEIYTRVNNGTAGRTQDGAAKSGKKSDRQGYIIPRVQFNTLYYPEEFKPKTLPNEIMSRAGGKNFNGPFKSVRWVWHPGIEPRLFDKAIAKKIRPEFERSMRRVMADIAARRGAPK